jgi:hypothetical protein
MSNTRKPHLVTNQTDPVLNQQVTAIDSDRDPVA